MSGRSRSYGFDNPVKEDHENGDRACSQDDQSRCEPETTRFAEHPSGARNSYSNQSTTDSGDNSKTGECGAASGRHLSQQPGQWSA